MSSTNDQYKFRWRRRWFWHKINVVGHKLEADQDKMLLYFPDGSLQEIKKWSDCEVKLGIDWVLVTERQIKEEAGQS